MIVIGIILSFVALAFLCWLLFALAVYALPFFAGVAAGLAAYDSNSGPFTAIVIGAVASSIVLVFGRVAFTWFRSPVARTALALLFIVPAAVAGYHAARGLAYLFVPADACVRRHCNSRRDRGGDDRLRAVGIFISARSRAAASCRSELGRSATVVHQ